jgi:hypothetical protein
LGDDNVSFYLNQCLKFKSKLEQVETLKKFGIECVHLNHTRFKTLINLCIVRIENSNSNILIYSF